MPRISNRKKILDAVVLLAGSGGVRAVTIEAVAVEAGLTKGGVQYHFPTKELMMNAVIEDLLNRWNADSLRRLKIPFNQATLEDRISALVLSTVNTTVSAGELYLLMDLSRKATLRAAWQDFLAHWVGDEENLPPRQRIALLAADGMWMRDVMGSGAVSLNREKTINGILDLIKEENRATVI